MIVTSDDRQHIVAPSLAEMTALVALAEANTVLVWDPADRTLIAANLRARCLGRKTQARRARSREASIRSAFVSLQPVGVVPAELDKSTSVDTFTHVDMRWWRC
jgi:hypothetical protein